MIYIYADTLAIATNGYWTGRRIAILTELSVTVTDETVLTVTVKTKAS